MVKVTLWTDKVGIKLCAPKHFFNTYMSYMASVFTTHVVTEILFQLIFWTLCCHQRFYLKACFSFLFLVLQDTRQVFFCVTKHACFNHIITISMCSFLQFWTFFTSPNLPFLTHQNVFYPFFFFFFIKLKHSATNTAVFTKHLSLVL